MCECSARKTMGCPCLKSAMIYGSRDIRVEEAEVPTMGSEDVLIRVHFCGICGSDVHRYQQDAFGQHWRYPMNSGHEYGGVVARVGENVRQFKVGDRVTLGVNWPTTGGAFAEYVRAANADINLEAYRQDR